MQDIVVTNSTFAGTITSVLNEAVVTAVASREPSVRPTLSLHQNSPNPFNPSTTIGFLLARRGMATLRVFDARGRLVKSLVNAFLTAGEHTIAWDGTSETGERVASGLYVYRLDAAHSSESRKMVLVK